jgi:hypothetical protein
MIGTIKLHTKSHETAKNLLFPLDKQLFSLSALEESESAVGLQLSTIMHIDVASASSFDGRC